MQLKEQFQNVVEQKESRPIKVDEVAYRYQISTSRIDDNDNNSLNLTLQIATGQGIVLKVVGLLTRDFWLDISDPPVAYEEWSATYPVLTPKHVAQLIRRALKNGWDPEIAGPPFVLNVVYSELETQSGTED